jgi:hypothetical protein
MCQLTRHRISWYSSHCSDNQDWTLDIRTSALTGNTRDPTPCFAQRYNIRVPPPQIPMPSAQPTDSPRKHPRHSVYSSQATGLLLIAFRLPVRTLIGYWQHIHRSLR